MTDWPCICDDKPIYPRCPECGSIPLDLMHSRILADERLIEVERGVDPGFGLGSDRGMTFEVMSRKCDQCLMSDDRIVSAKRAAQILRQCRREDRSFECHKGTMAGRSIACRGHWETGSGQMGRIAERLGMIAFVDPDTLEQSA